MSVNRPTNVEQRDQDINQKLQLYGIFTAFANGKVPSNKQIDVALNSALASRPLANPSQKLSSEGRQLVADLRDVIEQAKYLILTKNEGNLLQDFIWQTQLLAGTTPGNAQLPGAPIDRNAAKQHGNQALHGLRTLGTLVISNGQFRKLLSDATVLLRDMAGDVAQKAANKVNPSQDQLSRIDDPADDNTWHDTPDLSRENIKGQFKSRAPLSKGDLKEAAGDASQQAQGTRDPQEGAEYAAQEGQQGRDPGTDAQGGAKAAASTIKNKLSDSIPDEHKDRARDKKAQTQQRTKDYINDKIPQERREQTIYRLKKMIVEIQGHPDYQEAINTLLSLAEEYAGHSKNLTQQAAGTVKGAHTDNTLQMAEADMKTLIERFANSTSADDLIDAINKVYTDADRDPELKKWFRHMDHYVRKCLKEKGFVMQDAATEEWNQLYDRGNFLLRERYRDHTNRVIDEFTFLANQFDADPQNKRFAHSVQKLFQELGNDENGQPTFKPHLLKDLSNVILPGAFESVSYVPIPRIEYSDPMIDAIVENLIVESDNLMPNAFEVQSDNFFRWGRKTVTSRNKNKIMVSVSGVQMDLKDVSYYVKKKQGFPSLMDKGVMDIFLGGTGFGFKMAMETADPSDRQHFFKVNTVVVDVKNLKLHVKQSNHKLLFNLFKPIMLRVLTPVITKVLEKVIKDNVNKADGMAYEIYQEAQRAQQTVKDDPSQAPNIYSRYVNAAQKRMMQGKKKSQDVAGDKQVNIAMTQYDSIFKDIRLPGGISTKATDYKELARKGDKWESPVFGIGSARETTDLPRVTPVSRKPHNAASGSVRGQQNLEDGETTLGAAQHRSGGDSGYDQSYGQGSTTGYGQGSTPGYGQGSTTGYAQGSTPGYGQGSTTGYAQGSTPAYGQGNTPGYGQASTTGYSQGSAGYPDTTTSGYGQTNGSTGFSNQVSQAFGNDAGQDLSLKDNAGTVNGGLTQPSTGHTTLGMNNPVLRGLS